MSNEEMIQLIETLWEGVQERGDGEDGCQLILAFRLPGGESRLCLWGGNADLAMILDSLFQEVPTLLLPLILMARRRLGEDDCNCPTCQERRAREQKPNSSLQ